MKAKKIDELDVEEKLVIPESHMACNLQGKGQRKNMRCKGENVFMKDYMLLGHYVSGIFLSTYFVMLTNA